jgi:alpha-glucuronidase
MRQTLFELQDEIEIRAEYRQLASKVFKTTVFHEMIAGDTVAKPAGKPVDRVKKIINTGKTAE